MSEYWEDYSEYDAVAEELKASLINSVKSEIENQLDKLTKENVELYAKLANLKNLETEAETKLKFAERKERDAEAKGLHVTATKLLESLQKPAYQVCHISIEQDKCDKCNDKRQFDFTYPSGKLGTEYCECYYPKGSYIIKEAIGVEARIDFWGGKRELKIWYEPYDKDSGTIYSRSITTIYDGQEFTTMSGMNYIFYDPDTAQNYADYLNKGKESEK